MSKGDEESLPEFFRTVFEWGYFRESAKTIFSGMYGGAAFQVLSQVDLFSTEILTTALKISALSVVLGFGFLTLEVLTGAAEDRLDEPDEDEQPSDLPLFLRQ